MKKKILRTLMSLYKSHKQKKSDLSRAHAMRVAKSMLKKSRYALLVTNSDGSAPGARVVQPVLEVSDDFYKAWIGTHATSRKIHEIKKNDRVTLVVQGNRKSAQLILKGRASIESDDTLRRKYWLGVWRMFFPDGPVSSDYVLLQVVFDEVDILSFSQNIVPEPFGLKSLTLEI